MDDNRKVVKKLVQIFNTNLEIFRPIFQFRTILPASSPFWLLVRSTTLSRGEIISLVIRLLGAGLTSFLLVRWMVKQLDPNKDRKQKSEKKVILK